MSSIDKDMQRIASGYDSRVRVRNSSTSAGIDGCDGYISFYIGSECILTIKDRYGVIYDSEKAKIREAIVNYQRREADVERRRREEEERRRREDEERRRREEEERRRRLELERVAAYNTLVSSAKTAKMGVESSYATVQRTEQDIKRRVKEVTSMLSSSKFDVSEVKSRLSEIESRQQSSMVALSAERDRKIAEISRCEGIGRNETIEVYRRKQSELHAINVVLTSSQLSISEVDQLKEYVRQLLDAQEKLFTQCEQLRRELSLGGLTGEIAKIALQQIDEVNKNSLEQIDAELLRLQETRRKIESSKQENELNRIVEDLKNAPRVTSPERTFVPRQSTYCYVDYKEQCEVLQGELRQIYEELKGKDYTTATQSELEHIENALQERSLGVVGKNMRDALESMLSLASCINADDRACEDIFKDYARIKEDLAQVGIIAEAVDAFNYEAQRERLLRILCEKRAEIELEQEKEDNEAKRSVLSFGTRSAFADNGLYVVTGRVSDDGLAEEIIFALAGIDDVVIKAIVTMDSLQWCVCGTQKEDGSTTSAERVLEIMRVFDDRKIPQGILNSMSQTLQIQSCQITGASDSASEDALEKIVNNGIFSLSQQARSIDGQIVTAGKVMQDISREFAKEAELNANIYVASAQKTVTHISKSQDMLKSTSARVKQNKRNSVYERQVSQRPARRQSSATRARYMH